MAEADAGAGTPLAAGENAERALRFLHEEGEGGKKMSCRWFIDRAFYCVSTSPFALPRMLYSGWRKEH